MKQLIKTIEYGLYLLVFLLPWQTRWIIRPGELNGGYWEYGTYSLYGTDILLIMLLVLYLLYGLLVGFNDQFFGPRPTSLGLANPNNQTNSKSQAPNYKQIQNTRYKIQNYLIFGLLFAAAVSIIFALDKPLALYKLGWLALGAGLFWIITKGKYSRPKLIWSLLAGLALQAVLAMRQFFSQTALANKWLGLAAHQAADLGASVVEIMGADGLGERWLRAYGGMEHPNIFGGALAIGVLLLIGEIISTDKIKNFQFSIFNFQTIFNDKILKILFWPLLIFFTAALFFSFSRSAWLAALLGLVALVLRSVVKKDLSAQKKLAQITLIGGAVIFILFLTYPNLAMTRLYAPGRLEIKSSNQRTESVKNFYLLIKNHWAGGMGAGNYTLVLRDELKPREPSYFLEPVHNAFMLVWGETGIFGLIFFIGLLFVMARIRGKRSNPNFVIPEPIGRLGFYGTKTFLDSRPLRRSSSEASLRGNDKQEDCFVSRVKLWTPPGHDSQAAILMALIVLMSFDHWLWSLHFGALFFWLVLGLVTRDSQLATRDRDP